MDDNESSNCKVCLKPCDLNDEALECDMCEHWFHISCEDISSTLYNELG